MFLETVTGKKINVNDLSLLSSKIDINDIAWSLSRINRFVGHTITDIPYNVAQHSIFVANKIIEAGHSDKIALFGLLHDSAEAFIGDIPSPIKKIPEVKAVLEPLEDKILNTVFEKYVLRKPSCEEWETVKFFDKKAQFIEAFNFMVSRGLEWENRNKYEISLIELQQFPEPKTAIESYKEFLKLFKELTYEINT